MQGALMNSLPTFWNILQVFNDLHPSRKNPTSLCTKMKAWLYPMHSGFLPVNYTLC